MNQPTPMEKRPPIEMICYTDAQGNPQVFHVGRGGISAISETEEGAECCMVPWLEVWEGKNLVARMSQHKVEHILYRRQA